MYIYVCMHTCIYVCIYIDIKAIKYENLILFDKNGGDAAVADNDRNDDDSCH